MYTRSGYAKSRYARRFGATWSRSAAVSTERRRIVRRRPTRPTRSRFLVAILLVPVVAIVIVGGSVGLAATAAVSVLSSDLPDPSTLNALTFNQPTVVYDRTGTVVSWARSSRSAGGSSPSTRFPRLVLDATTTAEDRSFWQNPGFDPAAILSAIAENASGSSDRGASTITQQLVRARLLPPDATAAGADRYIRKAKELIQSSRVTDRFPGEAGKEQIISAYLNQIFYGHDAYGIAAAADIYFGVTDLTKLTPGPGGPARRAAEVALDARPVPLRPGRRPRAASSSRPRPPPVVRRNYILSSLNDVARWTTLSPAELQAALDEPVVLVGDRPLALKAPQFTWQVRSQLDAIIGDGPPVDTGGYTVITTLDWNAQYQAERWLSAAVDRPEPQEGRRRRACFGA